MIELPDALLKQLPEPDRHGLRLVLCPTEITLPDGSPCILNVTPKRQLSPAEGDSLLSTGDIYLPAEARTNYNHLNEELRFNDKLEVLGEALRYDWGASSKVGDRFFRARGKDFLAVTWLESLRAAEEAVLESAGSLWRALEKRVACLRSAGEDYYVLYKSGLAPGKE